MAHYAFIDENNLVTEVIVGKDEGKDDIDWEQHYQQFRPGMRCKRTSFNTFANQNLIDGIPFRKNFAAIGYTYDDERDAFIPEKLFSSWILDENTCTWIPPIPMPDNGKSYAWDEDNLKWIERGWILNQTPVIEL